MSEAAKKAHAEALRAVRALAIENPQPSGKRKAIKSLMEDSGLSEQAWAKWTKGSIPGLDSLADIAEAHKRRLVMRFEPLSGDISGASTWTTEGESMSDEALEFDEAIADLPPHARREVLGAAKVLAMQARASLAAVSSPSRADAGRGAARARRRR